MESTHDLRLAVLIDADNVSSVHVKPMMEEIAKYGRPTFKRIYGDWTSSSLTGWKKVLLESAITPVQQFGYTSGKNSTDVAMIIDAMDILYTGRVEGFCIVSSDSDFTRLAVRLKEAGMKIYGMGEKKTPIPFISSCDKFIYLEILNPPKIDETGAKKQKDKGQNALGKLHSETVRLIRESIVDVADDDGWAFLGDLGNLILKKQPDFDPRNYGFRKLVPLVKSIPGIELDERKTGNKNITHVFVRTKS
jgi:uncharacterized LabA/DUF88 family protein